MLHLTTGAFLLLKVSVPAVSFSLFTRSISKIRSRLWYHKLTLQCWKTDSVNISRISKYITVLSLGTNDSEDKQQAELVLFRRCRCLSVSGLFDEDSDLTFTIFPNIFLLTWKCLLCLPKAIIVLQQHSGHDLVLIALPINKTVIQKQNAAYPKNVSVSAISLYQFINSILTQALSWFKHI